MCGGQALDLTEKTMGNDVSTILENLHFGNRIELATYSAENHIQKPMSKE